MGYQSGVPLLLTSQDVLPLLQDASAIDDLMNAVATAYRDPHPFEMAGHNLFEAPLVDGESLRIFPSVAVQYGTALRIDPAHQQLRRQPNASRLVVLFNAAGELRSILAADLVHTLRIAAPSALAARLLGPTETRTLAVHVAPVKEQASDLVAQYAPTDSTEQGPGTDVDRLQPQVVLFFRQPEVVGTYVTPVHEINEEGIQKVSPE